MLMSWMSRLYGAGSGWHLLRVVCSSLVNQLSRVSHCAVPVHSVVRKSVMFSNVIVDIAFPRRSFVFGQSSCEVSASLTDVRARQSERLSYIPLPSVPRFVFVFDVSQYLTYIHSLCQRQRRIEELILSSAIIWFNLIMIWREYLRNHPLDS